MSLSPFNIWFQIDVCDKEVFIVGTAVDDDGPAVDVNWLLSTPETSTYVAFHISN